MQYKIAICDDEELQIKLLSRIVANWAKKSSKEVQILSFKSAEAFHFAWSNDKSFDILLLDIQMSGQNGIELAKAIREKDDKLSIVFITGLSEYINEGYEVSAIHYLLKPVKEEKLYECLDKACKKIIIEEKTILISCNGENIRINQSEITFIEAFAHSVVINTYSGSYEIKKSIAELEKELEKAMFARSHRSYIVGLKYIEKISKTDVFLESGKQIPVSRRLYNDLNKAFISYYRGVKK
jgi:DNA-binding LytR/AlgR family response regulator